MHPERFDILTSSLATSTSRREAVKRWVGAAIGASLGTHLSARNNSLAQSQAHDAEDGYDVEELEGTASVSASVAAQAAPRSQGLYAIPFDTGKRVKVSRDHKTHDPPNRIDLSGVGGGPYRVVAAASGRIRFLVDSHSLTGDCDDNNYIWIEHSNGEWTKYTHIAKDSASGDAGLRVGDAVTVGQFLGIEDDVGCAHGEHLHFEVAVPNDPTDPIVPAGGYIKGTNRVPKVCGIAGQTYVAGQTYTVPGVRPGAKTYARSGIPHSQFQNVFDAAGNCGYRIAWNDGFSLGGDAHFNTLFHATNSSSPQVKSHRMLSKTELDESLTEYGREGYELVHIDAYTVGSEIRYATIFNRSSSTPKTMTYYGLSADAHQSRLENLTDEGWYPRIISVASIGGTRTYAAIYIRESIGSYVARSFQTSSEYATNSRSNEAAGRRLIYLNSYMHSGSPHFSAIWASSAPDLVYSVIMMRSREFQLLLLERMSSGWKTQAITAIDQGGSALYSGFWYR